MTLAAGSRLGPYEIPAPFGAGGMGEVYRARDERLKRDVAVKVLPASYSQDGDRLRRFEQAAGALNHPNITAVYDLGSRSSVWVIGRGSSTCAAGRGFPSTSFSWTSRPEARKSGRTSSPRT